MTKQLGLRPLAVHFDNGWDSEIAKTNLRNVLETLDVDLHTVVADWEESRELTNCTIRASLPYIDMTDDVGIVSALYRTAAQEKIRWIIHSHSFRSEGINPLAAPTRKAILDGLEDSVQSRKTRKRRINVQFVQEDVHMKLEYSKEIRNIIRLLKKFYNSSSRITK